MTNTPMTFEAFAIEHGMSILKVGEAYSDDDTNYAHWVWSKCQAQQASVIADLVEALEEIKVKTYEPKALIVVHAMNNINEIATKAIAKVKGK